MANPIKEKHPLHNMPVSYKAPLWSFLTLQVKLRLSKPCVCRHGCPRGLGSCCGDRPGLISRELSNDTEGAKAESETHLKGKDYSLQNVKGSCYMKEQGRELKKDKEKEKHRQDRETGHEFLILLLSS